MNIFKRYTSIFLLILFGLIQTGCLGSFKLTNVTYQWNQTIGTKWVNEVLFVVFIPVYAITFIVDGFVLNAIEFWSKRPGYTMKEGEQKRITGKDGEGDILITRVGTGYSVQELKGDKVTGEAFFTYDQDSRTWYLSKNGKDIRLVQLSPDGEKVKIFKPDGSYFLADSDLRQREEIHFDIK